MISNVTAKGSTRISCFSRFKPAGFEDIEHSAAHDNVKANYAKMTAAFKYKICFARGGALSSSLSAGLFMPEIKEKFQECQVTAVRLCITM